MLYNEKLISSIEEEEEDYYNCLYEIPRTLYSSVLSRLIDTVIKKLSLSQDNIVDLKQEKEIKKLDDKFVEKLIKGLKIKFIAFFIVSFMLLIFFSFYIICFCGVYVNTQKHYILSAIKSLISSFTEPFAYYLIPTIFRILSLRTKKMNCCFFYKISSFIENFL